MQIIFRGKSMSTNEIAAACGMSDARVRAWASKGLSIDEMVAKYRPRAKATPKTSKAPAKAMFRGAMVSLVDIGPTVKVSKKTLRAWVSKGLDIDQAMAKHKPRKAD